MPLFPQIAANDQKRAEKEMQDKIKFIEGIADEVLKLLAGKDLDLNDTGLVLKVCGDRLNQKAAPLKLHMII